MESYDLKNVKVMVVDDHVPMRRLVMSLLRELGISQVSQASDGTDALKKIKEYEPDIIIADSRMEPMDGLELTRRVRLGEAGADPFMPIVMVSGMTEMRNIVEARDAGITEFLAKPISARAIYARLCSVVANPRPFVRTDDFFGPDRRRNAIPISDDRRKAAHKYPKVEVAEPAEGEADA